MSSGYWDRMVLQRQRHLKWPALDRLEKALMILCGIALLGFSSSTLIDILIGRKKFAQARWLIRRALRDCPSELMRDMVAQPLKEIETSREAID